MANYEGIVSPARLCRHRRVAALIGLALLLGTLSVAPDATAAGGSSHGVKRHSDAVVKRGYISVAYCRSIFMRARIGQSVYKSGESVNVQAVVQNRGRAACMINGAVGSAHQYIGPCGAFSMTVANHRGVRIWPGPIAPSCPAMGAVPLAPAQQIVATGTWPLTIGFSGFRPAPAGTYRIVVGSSIVFGIRINATPQ